MDRDWNGIRSKLKYGGYLQKGRYEMGDESKNRRIFPQRRLCTTEKRKSASKCSKLIGQSLTCQLNCWGWACLSDCARVESYIVQSAPGNPGGGRGHLKGGHHQGPDASHGRGHHLPRPCQGVCQLLQLRCGNTGRVNTAQV